jgi:hypothetical protein
MEATTNESVSQERNLILQLKRPLLPIEEYAARQGLSRCTVEQHVQSGSIQVRKYKGKTYVVDVPLSPYHDAPQELTLMEEDPEMTADTVEQPPQSTDTAHAKTISGETARIKGVSQWTQIPHGDPPQPSFLNAATWTARTRKVIAAAGTACLLAAILAGFYLYTNQTIQADRLDGAFATIQTVHNNSIQASQQLAALQTNLVESTAQLQSVKSELNKIAPEVASLRTEFKRISQSLETAANEPPGSTPEVTEFRNLLNKTRAEIQTLRTQIALTSDSLETTKQENAKSLGLIRGQIQQLTTLLDELAKTSQTPSEPDTSDE